ncbi:MAG TPA: c-type cytochrome biogenesis protein CcsB, partial [Mariprofundaceae bacterium]|nr:c-type cytochrome biogenesis protein CcsB [Mariprofundaceae bacterium]
LVPWLDGLTLMIVLTWLFTLLEPHASLISYEDQANLVSGKLVMTMNLLFIFSAVCYIMYLFAPDSFIGKMATGAAWGGVYAGGTSLLLRWYESYLFLGGDIGHAPVSNLYEVFILLFCITSCIYLAFERRYQAKAMGAFIMVIISAGVFFGIWLDSIGQADIKPLVPALQSYWMKIHVPLNFVGYGSFAVACAAGMAWLFRDRLEQKGTSKMLKVFPSLDQLDQLAYKSVAIGFPAFTLATILGAAWAAEAWGGYWSWDPKETWALIVWLFYGAYLHVRISHGWSGRTLAWWAVAGFLVTLFCFVGVNMYLSGLHSYGRLA